MTPQRLKEIKNGGAAATPGEREEIFALARSALGAPELASLAQMVCDPENQPHQYVGDPEGFARALQEAKPEAQLAAEYDPVSQKCRGDCDCSLGQTCKAYLVYKARSQPQPLPSWTCCPTRHARCKDSCQDPRTCAPLSGECALAEREGFQSLPSGDRK